MKGTTKKTDDKKIAYEVEVLKAKEVKDGVVAFDMKVNGVTLYGCWYREYINKEGKEGTMISFSSYKANNGEYYNHAWFPISNELKLDIIDKIATKLS